MEGWTLEELAAALGGQLNGPPEKRVLRPVPAGEPDPEGITFSTGPAYDEKIRGSGVGVALVSPGTELDCPTLEVPHPRLSFGWVLQASVRALPLSSGIHPSAVVSLDADIDPTAQIGPFAVIERGARIGPRARVYPFAYVGEDCVLGEGVVLYPHVVLYQAVRLGAGVIVHAGTVLGADGFGYFWDGRQQQKIPQVGGVIVGERSEIGANACIDRATCGATRIASGVKIDNLVQIGHNGQIGAHTVIAGQTGRSGSVTLGEQVVVGGQCAFKDHVSVVDGAILAGRTGVFSDIETAEAYYGLPAIPVKAALRQLALIKRLPEIEKRLRALEQSLESQKKT